MAIFSIILVSSVLLFVILGFSALSGMFSERVGIVNIGIEGMLIIGATVYGLLNYLFKVESAWMQIPLLIISSLATALFALLHGFVTIKLKGDHIISGVAINLLAPALSIFFLRTFGDANKFSQYTQELAWSQDSFANLKNIVSLKLALILVVFLVALITLNKTKWGLRLKAIGENPQAADVAGINVNFYKWQGLIISGLLAGLGGGIFYQWKGISFTGNAGGFGFLALTILIMGRWRTSWIFFVTIIFSLIYGTALTLQASNTGVLAAASQYGFLITATPFLITIFILIFTSKRAIAPAAVGQPYDKSKR
ncbi:ABC transporter permease [Mycoplasma sp. CB776]